MASSSQWKKIVINNTKTFTEKVYTLDDLHNFIEKNNMKSIDSYNTLHHSPLYYSIKGSSKDSGESSELDSIVGNVKLVASDSGSGVSITAKVGRVDSPSTTDISCGGGFIDIYKVIAAVAEACGFSIGYNEAKNIYSQMKLDSFDFGVSCIESNGMHKAYMVGILDENVNKIVTYCDYGLITNIRDYLRNWGLWNGPVIITPLEPTFHAFVNYDFNGRFPAVPDKYLDKCLEIIHRMVDAGRADFDYFNDNYIMVSINSDEEVTITVLNPQNGKLNFWERSTYINDSSHKFLKNDVIARTIRGNYTTEIHRIQLTTDGNLNITDTTMASEQIFTYKKDGSYIVFDSFGEEFRRLLNGSDEIRIGAIVEDTSFITEDSQAINIKNGDISTLMPDWWAERILVSTPDVRQWNDDKPVASSLNITSEYLPIAIPGKLVSSNPSQDTTIKGKTGLDTIDEILENDTIDTLEDIGLSDDTISDIKPPTITPTQPSLPNGVEGLLNIYELDVTDLRSFSTWLWDPTIDIESTIKKLVTSPYDAIIGLHAVFASPDRNSSTSLINLGNLYTSGITLSHTYTVHQYSSLSCGYVRVKPYFKNINDYKNTQIQLYLPFIGFVNLDTSEVMGKYVYVDYNLDFLTGACIAFVALKDYTTDDKYTAYQYAGNFAAEIPLTGRDYSGVIRNVIQAGIGAAVAGPAGAVAGAVLGASVPIQRSGGLGGNVGSMAIRKPYIIITRRPSYDASNRGHFEGLPQNATVKLSTQNGYTRIKYINLEGLHCTEEEKDIILSKLKEGVFI